MMKCTPEPIARAPDITGSHGRAWRVDHEAHRRRSLRGPDADAGVVTWVVEATWAHPLFHSYVLDLVHLRPLPDGRETKIYLHGATHEMILHALNPDTPREPFILGDAPASWLQPVNFAAQLVRPDDAAATATIEDAVRDICAGTLNPDTDAISMWAHRFGDNMLLGRQGGRA